MGKKHKHKHQNGDGSPWQTLPEDYLVHIAGSLSLVAEMFRNLKPLTPELEEVRKERLAKTEEIIAAIQADKESADMIKGHEF